MANMWKKAGLIKHARSAGKRQQESQGKLTSLEDMFMWHVWKKPIQGTFLPDFSPDEGSVSC